MGGGFEEATAHNAKFSTLFKFSLGCIARVLGTIENTWLQPFLLQVALVRPSQVGTIMLLQNLWDAFSDPAVGYLSDQTSTRWGRRRPWLLLTAIPTFCFFILQWLIPPFFFGSTSQLFVYYLVVLVLFSTLKTCQVIPYRALIPEVAPTYETRTTLAFGMNIVGAIAGISASFLAALIIEAFDNDESNESTGYVLMALAFGPFVAFPRAISSLFVKEIPMQYDVPEFEKKKRHPIIQFWQSLWSAVKFVDFSLVSLLWVILGMSSAFFSSNQVMLMKLVYFPDQKSLIKWVLLGNEAVQMLTLPLLWIAMKKITKKQAFYLGILLYLVVILTLFFVPDDSTVAIAILLCFCGFNNVAGVVVQAMVPDTIQAYVNQSPGRDDKATLYSITLLGLKIGYAISSSLSSFVLGIIGYDGDEDEQTDKVNFGLKVLALLVPALFIFVAVVLMYFTTDYSQRLDECAVPQQKKPESRIGLSDAE